MVGRYLRINVLAIAAGCAALMSASAFAAYAEDSAHAMHHHDMHAMSTPQKGPTRGYAVNGKATISFTCCQYSPPNVTISAGDSVVWNGPFSSHPLRQADSNTTDGTVPGGFSNSSGTTFTKKFDTPGTYYFLCTLHGTFGGSMRGSITVNMASGVPGPADLRDVQLRVAPNPTFVSASIAFALPHAMDAQLDVFDLHGGLVQRLQSGTLAAGEHRVTWDGKDARGEATGSGIYFVRLKSGSAALESKLIKLR